MLRRVQIKGFRTYEIAPSGLVCTDAVVDECHQPFKHTVEKSKQSTTKSHKIWRLRFSVIFKPQFNMMSPIFVEMLTKNVLVVTIHIWVIF